MKLSVVQWRRCSNIYKKIRKKQKVNARMTSTVVRNIIDDAFASFSSDIAHGSVLKKENIWNNGRIRSSKNEIIIVMWRGDQAITVAIIFAIITIALKALDKELGG
ncbi:hypothetical protein AB6A40_001788 [Gnathostoma spinigerum]|uniref:Uncharacterized protein n=1 Tax=Gnathostoma spinigerum TaxID=75299 RepID=A0ABD6ECN5_9BILA